MKTMKSSIKMLLISLLYCGQIFAADLVVSGTVPVILKTKITQITDKDYTVQEISNSPTGYKVTITTDYTGYVLYNNHRKDIVDGEAVLTNITHQDRSINESKILTFQTVPHSFVIGISAD